MKILIYTFFSLTLFTAASQAQSVGSDSIQALSNKAEYNKWHVGLNIGVTDPRLITGGSGDYNSYRFGIAAGFTVRKQLSPVIGLQLEGQFGQVHFKNNPLRDNLLAARTNYFSGTASGVVQIGGVSFLQRSNMVRFYLKGGLGFSSYRPTTEPAVISSGQSAPGYSSLIVPIGAGIKFRLSERMALNMGYTETFIDGDRFDGLDRGYPTKDHFGYTYTGLEITLGSRSKRSLEWTNPVSDLYDKLADPNLHQEMEALKKRLNAVMINVEDLKKDGDGDGVSDQFDKCPGTPQGSNVDGAGCVIPFPKAVDAGAYYPTSAGPSAGPSTSDSFARVFFKQNSAELSDIAVNQLKALANNLSKSIKNISSTVRSSNGKRGDIILTGRSSDDEQDAGLSFRRAEAVKKYFIGMKFFPDKLVTVGYGKLSPLPGSSTEDERVLNRSVSFGIVRVAGYFTVRFESTGSKIKESSQLNGFIALLQKNTDWKIVINGHSNTDEVLAGKDGIRERLLLADRRSVAVKSFLLSKGIDASRILQSSGVDSPSALKTKKKHIAIIFGVTLSK